MERAAATANNHNARACVDTWSGCEELGLARHVVLESLAGVSGYKNLAVVYVGLERVQG